jgi:CBS domain containing-hemolysin-like protein
VPFLTRIGASAIIAFAIINLLHLTHGEQTPTYLGVERSKFVCRYGARPLYWFAWLISPIMRLGDTVAKGTLGLFGIEMTGAWLETEEDVIETRADLRNRLGSLLDEGDLPEERREEVLNALAVGEVTVEEIMVEADEIVALSTTASVDENLAAISATPHTRFPLVGEDLSEFVGVVYVPSILDHIDDLRAGEVTFADIATPPSTVSPDTRVSDAIDQFQAEGQELALVVRDGDVVGLLTATDALEAVMGELEDPLDQGLLGARPPGDGPGPGPDGEVGPDPDPVSDD